MTLETVVNITGNLRDAYELAVPGTLRHVDQLTTERRTNPITSEGDNLRNLWFYTADGELYKAEKKRTLWTITREPQNVVLQDIDEAFRKLTQEQNYIPNTEAAVAAMAHADSVVVDMDGLQLTKDSNESGHFNVNPRRTNGLNAEQRRAAVRLFGPDEENFGKNMDMFAEAGISPNVFVLMPDYVQGVSSQKGSPYVARASWLSIFSNFSSFGASGRGVYGSGHVRGVRREVAAAFWQESHERSDSSGAAKNEAVPSAPVVTSEIRLATFDEVRAYSTRFVPDVAREQFEVGLRKLYQP